MPQVVPNNYFHTGVFTAAGAELLAGYTCLGCGVRSKTWVAFRVHRSQCSGRIWATGPEHEATLFHRLSAMLDAETTTASKTPATAMPAAGGPGRGARAGKRRRRVAVSPCPRRKSATPSWMPR